ncbi:MAG: helix-turn-helix domain-containing protein [Lachnospiraceae bacterium]|nr:helix-turn-helix domain-containing protein [Lachnospiraceae bacterium]MDD4525252.1 helix-turn-helix domain-containing protein [Lachnospiraceae bacterium]
MKLLFIEDEFYTREGIKASVDWLSLGIDKLDVASNGKEGWEKLSEKPDIILTDIRMPYKTGLEIAKQARDMSLECEIIFLSSYSDKEYLFTAISLSSVAYIEKPVVIEELSNAIRQAVVRREHYILFNKLRDGDAPDDMSKLLPDCSHHNSKLILNYIAEHYSDPSLSLASIAEFVNLSPAYLSDSFKKDTGKNIKQVISDIRLDKASELLRTTPLTVAEIAQKIGYRDSNYFSKFFKQQFGVSPHGYRDNAALPDNSHNETD